MWYACNMFDLKRTPLTLGFLLLIPFCSSAFAFNNSNSVQDSERLAQLNRATGASSGSSSTYENRLDALLSTDRTPERSYMVTDEANARQRAAVSAQEEAEEEARARELNPGLYNPKKAKDSKVTDFNAAKGSRTDGTERAYQTAKEEIQKEFDERIKKESQQAAELRAAQSSASEQSPSSASASGLAGNPFYVGEEKDPDQKRFDSRKAVIVSRLVERGISEEEANSSVGQATSEEDLIVNLMKNYDLSYGDASEAAS